MPSDLTSNGPGLTRRDAALVPEETHDAVAWGAVLAGAATALALAFVLIALAAGFGLKLAQPWPALHPSAEGFTPVLGAAMVAVQVITCGFGGYLAGRLRTKWTNVHDHEVTFRDTAHGVLVWALGTLAGAVFMAGVLPDAAAGVGAGVQAAAPVVDPAQAQALAQRATDVAAQLSLFMGVGLLLSGFTAAVAAAIGGLRRDEMHAAYRA